jgi:uncharacterized protein (TIGR01244 family)
MKYPVKSLAALLFLIILVPDTNAQADSQFKELPNFHKVNDRLFRGAQPGKAGLQKLAQLGIKTVINLRDDDERARAEEREAKALGLQYFNVPLSRQFRPRDELVERVMSLINAPQNQPVFVHCKRGADRTGTIVAIYRIDHDGWNGDEAAKEAGRYGMGFWQLQMKDYIHDYYRDRTSRKTGRLGRLSPTALGTLFCKSTLGRRSCGSSGAHGASRGSGSEKVISPRSGARPASSVFGLSRLPLSGISAF